jgi:hypothetical protein
MTWIKQWQRAWRCLSVRAMTMALAVQGTWLALPEELRHRLPDQVTTAVTIALLVLGLIGRMMQKRRSHGQD